jgi:hypothetical protein
MATRGLPQPLGRGGGHGGHGGKCGHVSAVYERILGPGHGGGVAMVLGGGALAGGGG